MVTTPTTLAAGRALLVLARLCSNSLWAEAQWPRQRSKLPPTADGRVDLAAAAPRLADGRPDLSGVWEQYGELEQPRYLLNIAADLKPEDVPLRPWAQDVVKQRRANDGAEHPGARCLPSGIPEKNAVPAPLKIVQTPDLVVILYESRTIFRQIFTDGRPLPPATLSRRGRGIRSADGKRMPWLSSQPVSTD